MSVQSFIEKHRFKMLLSILFLALIVRISVFPTVFSNGNITFLGADTYYHVRRILFTVLHFPNAISFDSYIDFPYGLRIGWMPLYDQFIALIALIAGLGKPSLYTIEATAAIIPPILGVLTVMLVYLISEKLFDWCIGLISAGIFAITPAHVYVSFLGYADHHVAETLLSTTAYLFFIIALKRSEKEEMSFDSGVETLKKLRFSLFTGIILAIALFTWNGAPIFIGLIGVFIVIQYVFNMYSNRNSDYLAITGGIAFLVSLLIITPFAITQGNGFSTNSYLPSLFHVGFLAVFVILCLLILLMQRAHFKKWWYHLLVLTLIFAIALYSLETIFPQFYQAASGEITNLFGEGVLSTVQEAVPLFINPATGFTLDYMWYAFTFSFFIALIAFIYFIKKTVREKYPSEAVFLIVWTFIVLILTILQRRFIYLLAVNIAIFSAYFIFEVSKLLSPEKKTIVSKKKQKRQRPSEPVSGNRPIIALILVALLAISNITIVKSMATLNAPAPDPDLQESFKWLKDNSPQTSFYEDPDKPAEYGVMSWWDYGNWILYFSERPVVANNFQTGIEDAAHFLIEPDENAANEILNKREVRFVITDAQMLKLKFKSIAMIAGRDPGDYYGAKTPSEEAQIRSVNNENNNFFATMLSRLHVFDGNGLSHYRLVYESKTTAIKSPDIKYVKIFEYVPGATLSGKTSVDGDVKVTLNIVTNQGRAFVYTQQTKANNGRYEIKVPYSMQGNGYGVKPTSDYIIQNVNTSRAVPVSEEDVMEGKVIQVDLV